MAEEYSAEVGRAMAEEYSAEVGRAVAEEYSAERSSDTIGICQVLFRLPDPSNVVYSSYV